MATYTSYPPKGYRVRMSTYWWLGRWPYLKFILREISSVFVAWFVIETLLQINALIDGPEAWLEMQDFFANPIVIALNVISLFFVVFHAITWFNLAPKAMAVRVGGKRRTGHSHRGAAIRGVGDCVGGRGLAASAWVNAEGINNAQAIERAFCLAALQRGRSGCGAADPDSSVFVWRWLFRWDGLTHRATIACWRWPAARSGGHICSCCACCRCFIGHTGFATRFMTACRSSIWMSW